MLPSGHLGYCSTTCIFPIDHHYNWDICKNGPKPCVKISTYQVNVRSMGRAVQLVGVANRSITVVYTITTNFYFTTRNECWKKTCGSPTTLNKSYICTANKPIRMYSNKFSSSCHGNNIFHSCKNQGHTHSSNCCHWLSRSRLWIN